MVHVTDCRSLYDLIGHRGTIPSERRLLLDIQALRHDVKHNNVMTRWSNTKQMLADCFTKDDARAADYLRYVLRTGMYALVEDPYIDAILMQERQNHNDERKEHYANNYPTRKRAYSAAEALDLEDGWCSLMGCTTFMNSDPTRLRLPPGPAQRWRLTLGLPADSPDPTPESWIVVEEPVDWRQPKVTARRRRPERKLSRMLSVYCTDRTHVDRVRTSFENCVPEVPKNGSSVLSAALNCTGAVFLALVTRPAGRNSDSDKKEDMEATTRTSTTAGSTSPTVSTTPSIPTTAATVLKNDVFDPVIYEMLQKQMQCQHVNLTSRGSNGWQVRNSCLDC